MPNIWAIADLHLSVGVPDKKMDVFGPKWTDYMQNIESHWRAVVQADDLVLVAGDISWAMKLEQAVPDLEWIERLPGTKLMIRGNHDYWWSSPTKVREVLPQSLHIIQNDAFHWNGVSFAGARLWDTSDYDFTEFIDFRGNKRPAPPSDNHLYNREIKRLRLSLEKMPPADLRIAMTHYPPIDAGLNPSKASELLEEFKVDHCVFGHLHSVYEKALPFGEKRGVRYWLTSCDYIDFAPVKIAALPDKH